MLSFYLRQARGSTTTLCCRGHKATRLTINRPRHSTDMEPILDIIFLVGIIVGGLITGIVVAATICVVLAAIVITYGVAFTALWDIRDKLRTRFDQLKKEREMT